MTSVSLRTGVLVAAIVVGFTSIGTWLVLKGLHDLEIEREQKRLDAETHLLAAMVEDSIEIATNGIRGLAASPVLQEYVPWLESPVSGAYPDAPPEALENYLVELLESRREYCQVRVLDADGWERARVNRRAGGVERVAPQDLQFKGERVYFMEAQSSRDDRIYVSRLELNRERGVIETPHVPVVRAATRLDQNGSDSAPIVLVNVDVREIFERGTPQGNGGTECLLFEASTGRIWASDEAHVTPAMEAAALDAIRSFAPQSQMASLFNGPEGDVIASLASFDVLASSGRMTVGLLRTRSMGAVLGPLRETQLLVLSTMVLSGLCIILGAILVVLRFSLPYQALARLLHTHGADIALDRLPLPRDKDGRRLVDGIAHALAGFQSQKHQLQVELDEKEDLIAARMENNQLRGVVLDNLPMLVAMLDNKKRFLYANSQCESWLSLSSDSAVGKSAKDVIDDRALAQIEPLLDQALAGSVARMETPIRHRLLESDRWLDIQCHPRISNGRINGVFMLAVDVESLKKAEHAASENAAHVEAVIEAAVDGIITIDKTGTVERVNSAALQMLGYRREELLGSNIRRIMPEPYRSNHDAYLKHYAETGERRIIGVMRELPVQRSDGSTFPVELAVSQVDREPDPFYLGILRDISERVHAAEALRESQERLALAIDGANDGLWDWNDTDGERQWWSPRFYQLLGYADGEIESSLATFRSLLHPADQQRVLDTLQHQIEGETYLDVEFRLRTKAGAYRWFVARARIYRNEKEGLMRVAGTLRDIHNRKMAEEARAEYEERLRSTVEELDRFAYIASHDLKAPLRAIDNLAKWIVEDTGELLPEKPRMYLDKMQGRIERMERLLDDLLRYSRVGRVRGEIAHIDLRSLVVEVCDMCNVPDGFTVIIELPDTPMRICVTPLKHIFQNLVSNAIKHHDRAEGTIEIEGHIENGQLHAIVRDDGPGIPVKLREKAFALFQTLRPRDQVETTGLGLAIVRKLVTAAGGEIDIEPNDGRGTTFRLCWPIEEEEE